MESSVVVTTYGRPDDLVECVESLCAGFVVPDEIIVVDDGDPDQTTERLAAADACDAVTHVEGPRNGLPAARNAGVEASSGDVVCFVDDDVVVPPTWLREVIETYERDEAVMGVGGYVLNFNPEDINKANIESFGYRALTGFRSTFLRDRVGDVSPAGVLWAPHTFMTAGEQTVDTLQGCNMSFRREVFERFRFDERYGISGSAACEEIDFCDRVSAAGHRLVYNPHAAVLHKRSIEGDPRPTEPNYASIANLTYFVLTSTKLGYGSLLVYLTAITAYATASRDPDYLRSVRRGFNLYRSPDDRDRPEPRQEGGN